MLHRTNILYSDVWNSLFWLLLSRRCVCSDFSSGDPTPKYNKLALDEYGYETKYKHIVPTAFDENALKRDYNFDIEGEEVLVFLHIQKTGGTAFGRSVDFL